MVNPRRNFLSLVFLITLPKKWSPRPKNGLYGCVSTPVTICAQNWGLNWFLTKLWQF
jgi:hypothetical protein